MTGFKNLSVRFKLYCLVGVFAGSATDVAGQVAQMRSVVAAFQIPTAARTRSPNEPLAPKKFAAKPPGAPRLRSVRPVAPARGVSRQPLASRTS